ncbi:helix-turn-helix domain-containing protein [Streptomyces acidicola]|uniref:helix-turn-helix domain-containing protein n=1 Tax=Streptomyces acidicola TaxID=2596892 RepID=UPI00379D9E86
MSRSKPQGNRLRGAGNAGDGVQHGGRGGAGAVRAVRRKHSRVAPTHSAAQQRPGGLPCQGACLGLGGVTGVRAVLPASGDRADSEDDPAVRPRGVHDQLHARCRGSFSQAGSDTTFHAGDLMVLDSSHPFDAHRRTLQDSWSQLIVQLPHKLLPLPEKTVQRLLAVPISGRHGMGGVLARWLTDLNTRAGEFTPADIPTLTSVTLDLLASVIARCLDTEEALTPETRKTALRAQINAFVEQNLADPAMTPQTIADAHHISLRHLQQLLAEDDTSPAAWIRRRRLERCRLDLVNPRLNARPIQAIAERWGFTNPTHFSRLFRATYGIPPRDYRNLPPKACANRQPRCAE